MRFGVFTSMGNQTWPGVLELWRHAEATGWDVACVTDHFMPNTKEREGDMLEGWSTLTALAALVPRMQVGTIVLGNTYRHPAVVAKMAAQVDIISDGRLLLGLGAGWQENEHEAYGIPFHTMRERLERLDEACQVMRSLWTRHRTTFKGRYYTLSDAPLQPKPVQRPHPELMIGGGVPKNFTQDTVVCAEILGHDDVEVHKYAVQITVADVRDGACSSSTLQEAASWGKVSTAMEQMVFAEATSVLPLLASDAWHRGAWRNREKRRFAKLFD